MSNNLLEQYLPREIFHNLTEIKILKMDDNKLKKLHPHQFKGLEKLSELYLSQNELTELPEGIFKGLKNVISIHLNDNKIRNVTMETFRDVKALNTLYLHYNLMSELPVGFFKDQFENIIRATLDTNLMCCHLEYKQDAECVYPYNDNFANCDSMFSRPTPRKSVWVIGSLCLGGAVFVTIWRLFFKEKNVVQNIMLTNLAVADGLMGVYLLTIGVKDAMWYGEYYLHDYKWRISRMCQVTGAIAILSSEASVMFLSLIAADRVKNIVFPYQGHALTRTKAHIFCFTIWVISFLIAFLPMFGIQYFHHPQQFQHYYGRSVVCLPLQLSADLLAGWEYSVSIFIGLNFMLFLLITTAYLMILLKSYMSSRRLTQAGSSSASNKREMALAKRVFCIIFTDALCWFPIIIYGIKSLVEKDFDVPGDLAVWIAVYVLPINSVINPFLYTLTTPQVQEILKRTLAEPIWNLLRRIFPCGHAQEDEEEEEQQEQQQQGIEDHDHHDHDEEGDHEQIEMGVLGLPQPHQDEHPIHEEQAELQSVHSVEKEHESEPAMCVVEVTAVRRGNRRGTDDLSPRLPANTQGGARKRSFFRKFSAFGQKEEKKREVQAGSYKTKKDIGDDHGECQPHPNQGYHTRFKAARRKQTPVQHVSSV